MRTGALGKTRKGCGFFFWFLTLGLCSLAGVKLTLSALIDGKNINAGGHKLGLGLELEA